jgi:hypothetical protein
MNSCAEPASRSPKKTHGTSFVSASIATHTREVIDWMLDSVNWWRFCQQVRAESGLHSAPPYPHIGFLLKQRSRVLKIMRVELGHSTVAAHVRFCTRLDQVRFVQLKTLILVYSLGRSEWLPQIDAAHTVTDLQRLFIKVVDQKTDGST